MNDVCNGKSGPIANNNAGGSDGGSRGDKDTVGEHSNFKIFLRTRKIMVMHSNERRSVSSYP